MQNSSEQILNSEKVTPGMMASPEASILICEKNPKRIQNQCATLTLNVKAQHKNDPLESSR